LTLGVNTVTQLLRMKLLYFVLGFVALTLGVQFAFPILNPEQELKFIRDVSLGALQVYGLMIAVAASALLLPKDLEDRTLYTILAKPVPRADYLVGKLLGVVLVVVGGILLLDACFCSVMWLKQQLVEDALRTGLTAQKVPADAIEQAVTAVLKQGLSWGFQVGVLALALKSCVLASFAFMVSCFASSSLFTMISTFCVAIIGHGEGMLREYFLTGASQGWSRFLALMLSILCPDMTLFDVTEAVSVSGIGTALLWMTGMACST
jgi:NAD-dependent oxidoreductase involved in siderophore biosynthesis